MESRSHHFKLVFNNPDITLHTIARSDPIRADWNLIHDKFFRALVQCPGWSADRHLAWVVHGGLIAAFALAFAVVLK